MILRLVGVLTSNNSQDTVRNYSWLVPLNHVKVIFFSPGITRRHLVRLNLSKTEYIL